MRNFNFKYALIINPEKDYEHEKTIKINNDCHLYGIGKPYHIWPKCRRLIYR